MSSHEPGTNTATKVEPEPQDLDKVLKELRTIFSSKSCNPPLGWSGVHAFENEHEITLPEPYRTFIAEIANGCKKEDGPPEYGLWPLTASGDPLRSSKSRSLDNPFPLTGLWDWSMLPDSEELNAKLYSVYNHGSVLLGDEGCGMYWHLIVSGELRGHICLFMEEGVMPFGKEFSESEGDGGFFGWVVHWSQRKEDWFI